MKVRDLKELLEKLPEGAEVFLSSDAEGNGFAQLVDFDLPYVRKTEVGYGRIDSVYWDEDIEDWDKDDVEDLETVVVLWPV